MQAQIAIEEAECVDNGPHTALVNCFRLRLREEKGNNFVSLDALWAFRSLVCDEPNEKKGGKTSGNHRPVALRKALQDFCFG